MPQPTNAGAALADRLRHGRRPSTCRDKLRKTPWPGALW